MEDLEKDAVRVNEEAALSENTRHSTSLLSGHLKYLVAVSLLLVYILLPLPAVFSAGNYLSASSSSALSSLLDFSFSSSPSSSRPCHSRHAYSTGDADSFDHHSARGYRAIFGDSSKSHGNALYAKGRPSLHAGPRDSEYNSKIEHAFLQVPNNESCIAASRR